MACKYDIIIIGAGNAGFGVSAIAHPAGKKIAFIENWEFGGTCPNRGCTPKKVLVAAAQALHEIEIAGVHGIETGEAKLDWNKMIRREKELIAPIPADMRDLAEKRGDIYTGTAKFVKPNQVSVNGTILEAENIVIATGSKPRPLPIKGAELMITSDEVLSDESKPDEIVFIGGGVIAMEFSHVYARAGTQVTILEAMPRLLPGVDKDVVAAIQSESERIGIHIRTGVEVEAIEKADGRLRVVYDEDGKQTSVEADRVVNGAGRIANVDGLDLEAGNIRHDEYAIEVDETLRSVSNPFIWVGGDALVKSPQLSPVATYEGKLIGENIVNGASRKTDYSLIPSAIYTVPALSSVGLSEKEAEDKGLDVKVTTSDMSEWISGKTYGETVAYAKVLVDEKKDRFVGAHIVGHHGEELIHLFAMAMRYDIAASALKHDVFAFPTFAADMKSTY